MSRSPLRIIIFVAFVDLVGFGLIIPLQAIYADRLGASGLTFGLLVGVYAAMQFVFNPILGRWSDRVGRRRVLLISIGGSIISHSLLGVADLAHSLSLLFIARMFDGITGANLATAQAYIADVTTSEDRAKGMGLFGAAVGLGFVIGPSLGAGLAALGNRVSGPERGTAWPAFGASVVAILAFILVWRILPESRREVAAKGDRFRAFSFRRLAAAMAHPRLRELFLLAFWVTLAFVLLEATFVYLCAHRFELGATGTGLLFAYIGMVMVVIQGGVVGRLVPRFGEMGLLATGPFITATGFVLLSFVPIVEATQQAWVLLLLGCLVVPIGHGLTGPNLMALVSRQAAAGHQGETFGLAQGLASLARAVGPPIGGLLYDRGAHLPYWVGAVLLLAVGGFSWWIRPSQVRALTEQSAREAVTRGNRTRTPT